MKKQIYLLWGLVAALSAEAQSISPHALNSTGGTTILNTNIYDWSVGEMTMVSTLSASNLIVTQGLLQITPDINNGIDKPVSLMDNIIIYPNPAQDLIYFQFKNNTEGKLKYVLTDVEGKVILSNETSLSPVSNKNAVSLVGFPAGFYFLTATLEQTEGTQIKTYKIQKVN